MNAIEQWLADPFHSNMDATDWLLFVGLLLVAVALWNIFLSHFFGLIRRTAAEVV